MSKEYEKLKEALKKTATPEARKEAAKRFEEYEKKSKLSSKPTLVSLGLKTYAPAIPLEKIANEIERNPEFFELMGRVVKAK